MIDAEIETAAFVARTMGYFMLMVASFVRPWFGVGCFVGWAAWA